MLICIKIFIIFVVIKFVIGVCLFDKNDVSRNDKLLKEGIERTKVFSHRYLERVRSSSNQLRRSPRSCGSHLIKPP